MATGCAVPCVDDGLGQRFCPEAETETAGETTNPETGTSVDEDEAGEGDGFDCPVAEVELTPQTPTIVLLVDRSASMDDDFGGVSRWQAVGQTLFDVDVGVVSPLQDDIRFGLALYDNPDEAPMCPRVESTIPALDSLAEMSALFASAQPAGDTPTGMALSQVAETFVQDPTPGDKVIVLATDGEPDTCEQPNPDEGQAEAVAAASAAYASGVRTVIVSVGGGISADHLQDMANAGAGVGPGDPQATYHQALDETSLIDAFAEIISGVRDCTIDLDTPLLPQAIDLCQVTINGDPVPFDENEGWKLNDTQEIELVGGACDAIQDGEIVIEMNCDCEAIDP